VTKLGEAESEALHNEVENLRPLTRYKVRVYIGGNQSPMRIV